MGKRATLWMYELLQDLEELEYRLSHLRLLGCKGTTGTQASFLELFEGDQEKVWQLDRRIAREMGFAPDQVQPVSGQTYYPQSGRGRSVHPGGDCPVGP